MKNCSQGRIKRREYLMYLVAVRDQEHRAREMNLHVFYLCTHGTRVGKV